MSAEASTERVPGEASALLRAAAEGELPEWACAGPKRREHIARVVELLDGWARDLRLPPEERLRWRAAGWLHDALRDAPPEQLRPLVPEAYRDVPPPLLHGPAVAERIAPDADESVRAAVRYHTIGHASLDRLGRALYLADFLEPGREFSEEWRAELRARMPGELGEVLKDVVGARIRHLLDSRKPIRPETAGFWSSLVGRSR